MSHRRAKKTRREQRQLLMDLGATKAEAKAEIAEASEAEPNFVDNDATRSDRRERRFKPRRHAATLREQSFLNRRVFVNKWNATFTKETA